MVPRTFYFVVSTLVFGGCVEFVVAQEMEQQPPTLPEIEVQPETLAEPESTQDSINVDDVLRMQLFPFTNQRGTPFETGRRVTRSLLEDPVFRTLIDRRELAERIPVEMFDAMQNEVGVVMQRTQRGSAAPFIRGLTGQQVLILVDGIRLNNATFRLGPNQFFDTIDPGMVQHIEVIRGPQAVLYGSDALGGVINVVTRSGINRGSYDSRSGQWIHRFSTADLGYYSRMNVEGSVGNSAFFGGASYGNFNSLDRGGTLGRQPWTDYSQWAGDVKLEYRIRDNYLMTLSLQHFEQEDVARSDRFPSRLTVIDPQQRSLMYWRYQGVELPFLFDRFSLTTSLHRQREEVVDRRFSRSTFDEQGTDNVVLGFNALFSSDLAWLGRLNYGLDMYHDNVSSFRDRYVADTGEWVGSSTPPYPDDGIYNQFGTFAEWSANWTERLSSVVGTRFTRIGVSATPTVNIAGDDTPVYVNPTFQNWSTSLGLNYALTSNLRLVSSVADGFRAPNLDDLAATNDNVQQDAADTPSVDLRPENSRNYDVGLKLDGDQLRGEVFYFWMDIEDMILRSPASVSGTTTLFSRSNRDAHINGLELALERQLESGWSVYGNFTYYHGVDLEMLEPLSRIPPTQGIVGMRWRDLSGTYIDGYLWLVRRADRLNFQDVTDRRIPDGGTPGYGTLNVRAGRWISSFERISLWVENLTDRAYRVHGSGVDGPGASAHLGYELSY